MPVSKNRKGHAKKVSNYRKRVEDQKKAYQKQLRELYEKQQHEALDKQISSNDSEIQDAGIDASEFELEDVGKELPLDMPEIIEGVSDPSQL